MSGHPMVPSRRLLPVLGSVSLALQFFGPAAAEAITPEAPLRPVQMLAQAPAAPAAAQPATPAPAPAPIPVRTEILRFDNWLVTCNDFDAPKKRLCEARLQFVPTNANQAALVWSVWLNDAKQLQTRLQTPTGVAIPIGVELQPEKGALRKLAYESCETGFCLSGVIMDGALVRDLSTSSTANVTVQASNGNRARFNVNIKGFDKAYAAIRG